jgi:hypothetical protein
MLLQTRVAAIGGFLPVDMEKGMLSVPLQLLLCCPGNIWCVWLTHSIKETTPICEPAFQALQHFFFETRIACG